jgi:broad specificity phosphatase PhoE
VWIAAEPGTRPSVTSRYPNELWIVRHGQSAGNVARDAAEAGGLVEIDLPARDMDVPLSDLGSSQARALGRWIGAQPADARPTVVLTSPYVRAAETARLAVEAAGLTDVPVLVDDRLREREFGALDGLTRAGIVDRFPDEARRRALLGKFYHRPAGGESWCDVGLRLRSLLDTIRLDQGDDRVLLVTHQVVVSMLRYLLERMSEAEVLEADRTAEPPNCSVTRYRREATPEGREIMRLEVVNYVAPLEDEGAAVTRRPDVAVGPR